ncbi:phosphatase 2C family protein [Lyngbya aestuarii BL J]|uniref:Phosphatase 2C family protein n=1 Tax=Lyngbya aestuarii BL J TaxID=1348334 RepID=U7QIH0_9CYAN|nr:protein phosphatase 2C domain-containing protein [Lyngbya aestuarii]ERT07688.1 phosphatase 2C family protein [Lyngbya aestuarii BL J]
MQNHMPKHYLLAVGKGIETLPTGTLIADRYLLRQNCIVVDTRPEQFPEIPEGIPEEIAAYLRLFPYRLHLPVVYGLIPADHNPLQTSIWLLEQGPVDETREALMPSILELWAGTSALRQLNWLWQIAQLWKPFQHQQVASSLLNPQLLRIEGSLVRLSQLDLDLTAATLAQLGQLWQSWIENAHPKIHSFLGQLTQQMIAKEIRKPEHLIYQLDQAMAICGRSLTRRIEIITATDTGPTRSHNEDACYPQQDTLVKVQGNSQALSIVCDGIGGQEGGEVASNLAIRVLREDLENIRSHPANWDSTSLMNQLKRATNIANDVIAQRNDSENRQGRERMGTTLVMALTREHEVYITHVGDSRAYWITRTGCHQVTLDDDVASREVRLGYALYRDAIQPRSSGALIQALGITSSATLYPTVQRFPIDEDCIFLLCSDGLSDKDRIESYWKSEILPIINAETDIISAKNRLIEIANTLNGHDNVTISLLHFRVSTKSGIYSLPEIKVSPFVPNLEVDYEEDSDIYQADDSELPNTEFVDVPSSAKLSQIWLLSLGIAFLLGLGGVLVYIFYPERSSQSQVPVVPPTNTTPPSPTPQFPISRNPTVSLKSIIQLGENTTALGEIPVSSIQLLKEFGKPWIKGEVPEGTVFQVMEKQSTPQSGTWLELKICYLPNQNENLTWKKRSKEEQVILENPDFIPSSESAEIPDQIEASENPYQPTESSENLEASSQLIPPLQAGDTGWIRATDVSTLMVDTPLFRSQQKGVCQDVP